MHQSVGAHFVTVLITVTELCHGDANFQTWHLNQELFPGQNLAAGISGDMLAAGVRPPTDQCVADAVAKPKEKPEPPRQRIVDDENGIIYPYRLSLFSNVPPYINFNHNFNVSRRAMSWPPEFLPDLVYQVGASASRIARSVMEKSHFSLIDRDGKGFDLNKPKVGIFDLGARLKVEELTEWSKFNHFPGNHVFSVKDRLWRSIERMQKKFGLEEFNFFPRTYVVPEDYKVLKKVMKKQADSARYMMKPPDMSRGRGVTAIYNIKQVPKDEAQVVQEYITRPHLINGKKYDIRFHVLITSVAPLRVYLFKNAFVRFANKNFTTDIGSLRDSLVHITTLMTDQSRDFLWSIKDPRSKLGQKWYFKDLVDHLETEEGIDFAPVWSQIQDLLIKTFIGNAETLNEETFGNKTNRYAPYELFGVDIMLDQDMKPWLIEFNLDPSMTTKSLVELLVREEVYVNMFNVIGHHFPCNLLRRDAAMKIFKHYAALEGGSKLGFKDFCLDKNFYTYELSDDEAAKHKKFEELAAAASIENLEEIYDSILKELTPDDARILMRHEDEVHQAHEMEMLIPSEKNHRFLKFYPKLHYYDLLLDAWNFKYGANAELRKMGIERLEKLAKMKLHLFVKGSYDYRAYKG